VLWLTFRLSIIVIHPDRRELWMFRYVVCQVLDVRPKGYPLWLIADNTSSAEGTYFGVGLLVPSLKVQKGCCRPKALKSFSLNINLGVSSI
jgi:hypothetical protein